MPEWSSGFPHVIPDLQMWISEPCPEVVPLSTGGISEFKDVTLVRDVTLALPLMVSWALREGIQEREEYICKNAGCWSEITEMYMKGMTSIIPDFCIFPYIEEH